MHVRTFSSPLWRRRYRFAFLAVAIATGCVGLLMLLLSLPAFVIYIAAIAVSTSYGGVRTGLVAVALAFFASTFLFIPPYFSLTNERSVWPLLMSYCSTVVLSGLATLACSRPKGERKQGTHGKLPLRNNGTRMNGRCNPHQKH